MDRPEGCRFWVAEDVVDWIKLHVPDDKLGSPSSEEAAVWWLAVQNAGAISDMNRRELAEMLVDGLTPLDIDDVT